ncbi:COG4280 domain-containing protein [Sinomonas sp. G460-2]|uniref:COG4280 domain-containing protein n=1 Tax=Sinomonas sp. G460-2 TaxID=3393464 RepID=UPI0039EE6721
MSSAAVWGLAVSVFIAALVEMVEALTIVLAMGVTRGWKSALTGVVAAIVALSAFTAATGYALATWLPRASLQLVVGILLLIFGLQWLRKAILRSSGRKALHDEALVYEKETKAAAAAGSEIRFGLDWFSFVVSFKGVFLEGVEVVFIVMTFGLNAGNMPVAILGAAAAFVVVLVAALAVHAPLTRVPENTLKFCVGLLLATFGTFWSIEGLGSLTPSHGGLEWLGSDLALLPILAGWLLVCAVLIRVLKVRPAPPTAVGAGAATEGRPRP